MAAKTSIEYTGRHVEIPESVKRLAARKLQKLEKVLGAGTSAHVVLAMERSRSQAEVTLVSPHLTLQAKERGADFGAALTASMDKLARQVQTRIGKLQSKRRRAARTGTAA